MLLGNIAVTCVETRRYRDMQQLGSAGDIEKIVREIQGEGTLDRLEKLDELRPSHELQVLALLSHSHIVMIRHRQYPIVKQTWVSVIVVGHGIDGS